MDHLMHTRLVRNTNSCTQGLADTQTQTRTERLYDRSSHLNQDWAVHFHAGLIK